MINNLEELKQHIITSKNFKEIKSEDLLSQLSDTDDMVLIRDIFVSKGKKIFFKGNQEKINKAELGYFLKEKLTPSLHKNYILVINNENVCAITEDGIIYEYTIRL
ncbi:hypothetical protein N6B72_02040 [Chryseobacterium soli]|uniref:hypothetical protein n=1 Tax=Chryseobacterium soli TaxID=445961 RepID=UPI002954AF6F|nr:hypothetical protein [Chryseobacterium soli]MDV7695690.1 hypothetical protein [Chryseobacterium soli]